MAEPKKPEKPETIQIQVTATVTVQDAQTICEVFGVEAGEELAEAAHPHLAGLAKAALAEYLIVAAGRQYPSSVRDLRELRLRLLASHLPGGLPTDAQVAQLFQLTSSQARTLVAGARARYRRDIGRILEARAKDALRSAPQGDDGDHIRITAPDTLARYMEDLVATTTAPPPSKRSDASQLYEVQRATVNALCDLLGLDVSEVKGLQPKK